MKLYYFFFLTLISSTFFAQENTIYLKEKSLKLKTLDSLIKITKSNEQFDLMVKYSEEYINLAIKEENYEEAISKGVKVIYYVNAYFGETDRALKIIKQLEEVKENITDSFLLGNISLKKGGIYFNGKSYKKAIDNYSIAINKFSEKDSIYIADTFYFRGQAYFNQDNFYEALNDFEQALNYYTNLKDQTYIFYTKSSIINIHSINNLIKKTIKERLALINEKITTKFTEGLSSDYLNLAKDYKKNKEYKNEKKYLLKALDFAKKENDKFRNLSYICCDLSRYYLNQNNIPKAEIYYQLASKSTISKENDNYFQFLNLKSYYLFKTKKFDEALKLAKENLAVAKRQNYSQNIISSNKLIYEIYKAKNIFPKALEYYTKYNQLKDSLFNIDKINTLYFYQTLHETKLKEKEIKEQKKNIDYLTEDKKNKQLLFYSVLLLSFLIILTVFLLLNRFHLKRNQQLQKIYSQNLLSYIDNERKRISKDIHDSLGHKLLLVKNEAILNKNEKICTLADESIEEIRTISRNLQPIQIKQIGISKSIQLMLDELASSYKNILIFGDIDDIDDLISFKEEMSIYRIIQECLNNIIKHSKADSAKINITHRKKEILLNIRDNGIGFNYSKKFNNHKNLGLKNLKNRVDLFKGTFKINSKENKGTLIKISIPLK